MYRVTVKGRNGYSELVLGGLDEAAARQVFGTCWALPGDVVKLERGEQEVLRREVKVPGVL